MIEIWIRGRKLCEVEEDNEAIEFLINIISKAGYSVLTHEEDGKVIMTV